VPHISQELKQDEPSYHVLEHAFQATFSWLQELVIVFCTFVSPKALNFINF
jgi:hypothetical protein